jgi:hypothetical protein
MRSDLSARDSFMQQKESPPGLLAADTTFMWFDFTSLCQNFTIFIYVIRGSAI